MKAVDSLENNKYSVEEVTLDPPKAGELKIKLKACGVCHSDLSVIKGILPLPKPIVLGHEGAGIIEEIGEGVTGFEVGDHVILSFTPACGSCASCHRQAGAAGTPKIVMPSPIGQRARPASLRRQDTTATATVGRDPFVNLWRCRCHIRL